MAYENVRPFYLDTSGFDNALEGMFAAIKKKKEDAGYGELLNSLTGGGGPAPAYGNALAAPAIEPMQQPGNPPVLQAGYGRESGPGAAPQNALSPNLVSSIKGFEGYAPRAQWDYKQHSVGYGTRANYPGEVIDKPEAERRLNTEIGKAKGIVDQFAPNAPQGVKDALTSLTYNSGDEWTRSGLGAAIKRGDYTDAQRRFVQYNRAGGQVNKGLVNRRNQEAQWFNGGSGGQSAPQAQPPQVADASGGGDQARMLAWARANPGHPAAKAIASTMVEQRMDPTAGLKLQQAQANLQGTLTEQQRASLEFYGKQAMAVAQMPAGPQRAAVWQQVLQRHTAEHPGDEITAEEADPMTGPQLMAAQAGQFLDPNKQKADALGLDLTQAQIDNLRRKQDDPIEQMLSERLKRIGGPAPAASPVQPQSFNGQGPAPGVQLIADEAAPAQPQPAPDADSIEVPMFGKMPRKDAQELGMMLQMSPKYATLGKSILDMAGGAGGAAGMTKPAETQLDEKTISAASTLGRLQAIKQQFKPEFQQIPNKLKLYGASWGAAFGGKLNPEMQRQLGDFSAFKATAFDNFNQLLKELSGTAVSAQELSRQQIVQPNPGEGLFDGDDPVTFMSKIEQGEKIAKAAVARMTYMRSKGLQFNKDTAERFMRLADVPAAIDQRGAEIERDLKQANPKADPMTIEKETARQLKREFGI